MPSRRVALVTGSGKKRVGSVVAEALARRGFAIAVHYRSSATEAGETTDEPSGRSASKRKPSPRTSRTKSPSGA